jgi:hypothetical protein
VVPSDVIARLVVIAARGAVSCGASWCGVVRRGVTRHSGTHSTLAKPSTEEPRRGEIPPVALYRCHNININISISIKNKVIEEHLPVHAYRPVLDKSVRILSASIFLASSLASHVATCWTS